MALGFGNRRANGVAAGTAGWRVFATAAVLLAPQLARADLPPAVNAGPEWRIVKEAWGQEDEAGYQEFVLAIGRSDCTSIDECLNDPANPYRATDRRSFYGDCADMAYILRAYYAWKNGLPFSYQNAMKTADGSAQDLRYSQSGNVVVGRRDAIGRKPIAAPGYIGAIGDQVSTAMFRTHPVTGGGRLHDDFYSIEISRQAVRPGVVAYDIYGHVGIVYGVEEDGRILVIASHPDQSVTRTVYGPNFLRAKPELGAGLKGWRPVRLDGATRRSDGALVGGKLVAAANEEIADFSLEQYFGNVPHPSGEWHYGEFSFAGRTMNYFDYVRRKLAGPGFRYDPVAELRHGLQTICGAIMDRRIAVTRAVGAGYPLRPHPERLPPNIFGTYGEWENFSTPSRDARLKVSFIEMRRTLQELVELTAADDPGVRYEGTDLGGDLWRAFEEEKDRCQFIYRRSDDTRMRLNLGHVMDRLWELSFDPYNCPERRWGAAGAELETCTDDEIKARWHNALRFLRYQAERTYDVRMDFTLEELQPPMSARPEEGGVGVEAPADADIRGYLARLSGVDMAAAEGPPEPLAVSHELESARPVFPAWHLRNRGADR